MNGDAPAPEPDDPIALARQVVEDAVRLARAEVNFVLQQVKRTIVHLAIAIAMVMVAAVFLLVGVIDAFGALPEGLGILGSSWARWAALGGVFLLLAALFGVMGAVRAKRSIDEGRRRVQDAMKEDAAWLQELTRRSVSGS